MSSLDLSTFTNLFVTAKDVTAVDDTLKRELAKLNTDLLRIGHLGLTDTADRDTSADFERRRQTIIASKDKSSKKLKDLRTLLNLTQAMLVEMPALLNKGRASIQHETDIGVFLGQLDIVAPTIGEGALQAKITHRLAELKRRQGPAASNKDINTREPPLAALRRDCQILVAVAERTKATSDRLTAARATVGDALTAAHDALGRIAEPLAKTPLQALHDKLRAQWDTTLTLTDLPRLEAGIKKAEDGLPELKTLTKTAEDSSANVAAMRIEIGRQLETLATVITRLGVSKSNLEKDFAAARLHAEGLPTEGAISTLEAAMRGVLRELETVEQNVAWVAAGGDELLAWRKRLEDQFSDCAEKIRRVEEERIKKPLQDKLGSYITEKQRVFALDTAEALDLGFKELDRQLKAFAEEIATQTEKSKTIGKYSGVIQMAPGMLAMLDMDDATKRFLSPEALGRLRGVAAETGRIGAIDDIDAYAAEIAKLGPLVGQVEAEFQEANRLSALEGKVADFLKGAADAMRRVKLGNAKTLLQGFLKAFEVESDRIKALGNPALEGPALAKLTQDLETLAADSKQVRDKSTEIDLIHHRIDLQLRQVPTGIDAGPITARRSKLQGEVTTRVVGGDTKTLLKNVEAYAKLLRNVSDDLAILIVESRDVGATMEELTRIVAAITTAIDGLNDETPGIVPAELTAVQDDLANLKEVHRKAKSSEMEAARHILANRQLAVDTLTRANAVALKARMAAQDGGRFVDQTIAAMNGTTDNIESECLCRAAIEAKFGKTLKIAPGLETTKLPKLYELLNSVPIDHVALNKSLETVEINTEPKDKHNYYQSSRKVIAFNNMAEDDSPSPYQPDDGEGVSPTFYDSTTLHEVGHAVDDRNNVMNTNGKSARYGQWKSHKIEEVAEAYVDKGGLLGRFSGNGATKADLKTFVIAILNEEPPAKPRQSTDPLGSLLRDWDAIGRDPMVEACRLITESKSPWYKGKTQASQVQVDGRVYQEAYENDWVSYVFSERAATGISEYQWRAPAEWFAEIYALYYLHPDKVPDIPVKKWLDQQKPL
jgi:hypothetical protein